MRNLEARTKMTLLLMSTASWLFAHSAVADEALDQYRRGVELFNQTNYADAAKAFREAYGLKPSWKLYYNIGQAEAAGRRYGLALDAFEAYLVEGGDEVDAERREAVLADIKNFKMLVGTIEVEAPAGSELFVDGEPRSKIPLQGILRVAAGSHRFLLKKGDHILLDKKLKVAGDVRMVLKSESIPEGDASKPASDDDSPPASVPAHTEPSKMNGKTVAGIVTGTAGLAGLAVGIVFYLKSKDEFNKAEDQTDVTEFNKWDKAYKRDNAIGISTMAVGGALVTTGVILLVVGLRNGSKAKRNNEAVIMPTLSGLAVKF